MTERSYPKVFDIEDVSMNQNLDHLVETNRPTSGIVPRNLTEEERFGEEPQSIETRKRLSELDNMKGDNRFWYKKFRNQLSEI